MDATLFLLKRADSPSSHSDLQLLAKLDQASASFLQQNLPEKAMEYAEEAARVRRALFGERSAEAVRFCNKVVTLFVGVAGKKMEKGDTVIPLQVLNRLERVVSQFPVEFVVSEACDVYNSLSCAYRKHGQFVLARQYSLKALQLSCAYKDAEIDRVAIILNMCAVLDGMALHREALEYALKAVQSAQEDLVSVSLKGKGDIPRKVTMLAVAYHNAGVQEEHLLNYETALNWYEKAQKLVQEHGQNLRKDALNRLEKTYSAAIKELERKIEVIPSKRTQSASKLRPPLHFLSPKRENLNPASPRLQVRSRLPKAPARFRKPPHSPRADISSATTEKSRLLDRTNSPVCVDRTETSGVKTQSARQSPSRAAGAEETMERSMDISAKRRQRTQRSAETKGARRTLRLKGGENSVERFPRLKDSRYQSLTLSRSNSPKQGMTASVSKTTDCPLGVEGVTPTSAKSAQVMSLRHAAGDNRELLTVITPPRKRSSSEEEATGELKGRGEREERAARVIQTRVRNFLKKANKPQVNASPGPILTVKKTFRAGWTGEVAIYKEESVFFVSVSAPDKHRLTGKFSGVSLPSLQVQLEVTKSGELTLAKVAPVVQTEFTTAATRIQALMRGYFSRCYVRLLRRLRKGERKVVLRAGRKLNGQYVLLSVVKDGGGMSVTSSDSSVRVPASLSSPAAIVDQVRLRGDRLTFVDSADPVSPPAPRDSSRPVISFASMLSTPREKRGLSLIFGRKPVSIEIPSADSPVSPSSLSASPAHSSNSPLSTDLGKYDEHRVALIQSAFRMRIQRKRYIRLRSCERKRREIIAQRAMPLGSKQFFVSFSRLQQEEAVVEVDAYALEANSPHFRPSVYPESQLKSIYKCTDALYVHIDALFADIVTDSDMKVGLSRLCPSDRLSPISPDQSIPTIHIYETESDNILTTLDPARIPPIVSIAGQHTAARRIQCLYRKFSAKCALLDRKRSKRTREVYRTYRLFYGNRSFAVSFSQPDKEKTDITAIDLERFSVFSLRLSARVDYEAMDYREISRVLWTKGSNRLGVFLIGRMTETHQKAALEIGRTTRGWLARLHYREVRLHSERRMARCILSDFSGVVKGVAGHLYASKLGIECFPVRKQGKDKARATVAFFSLRELNELYPPQFEIATVLADVVMEHEKVTLAAKKRRLEVRQQALLASKATSATRSILRTSRKLDDRMWVVTMNIIGASENVLKPTADDIVEFSAFCMSHQTPIRTKTTVEELARLTKLAPDNIFPIGTLAVQKLLKVKNDGLIIDETEQVPEIGQLATLIQAHIRGFITRMKMMHVKAEKSQLISCSIAPLDGSQWILYAYREPPFIRLEAVHRVTKAALFTLMSDNIFNRFPPTLSKKRIIDNFIFPKLQLVTETGVRHLRVTKSMALQQNLLDRYQNRIKVITGRVETKPRNGESPPVITVLKADLGAKLLGIKDAKAIPAESKNEVSEDAQKLPVVCPAEESMHNSTLSLSFIRHSTLEEHSPKQEKDGEEGESSLHCNFLQQAFIPRREKRKETRKPTRRETRKPTNAPGNRDLDAGTQRENLIVRSGLEQDGHFYLASIFRDRETIIVEVTSSQTQERAETQWRLEGEVENLEEYCGDLLNRIKIRRTADDRMEISIEQLKSVLYKKSHYISNRYCVVTVSSDASGLTISACDPEKQKTYDLPIGPRPLKTAEALTRDMSSLVKRLRITDVFGEETLSLAAK